MKIKSMKVIFGRQRGFSLLEALLAIVIILAAGLGVVELYISSDKKNKLQTTEQIAQQVAGAATQLLSSTYDPADTISTTDVINSGLLSQNVIVGTGKGATIRGPYGTFDVASDVASDGTTRHENFKVTVNDLPSDQAVGFCQNMLGNFAIFKADGKTVITKVADCATSFNKANTRYDLVFGYPRANYTEV